MSLVKLSVVSEWVITILDRCKDLTGLRFGRLTAIKPTDDRIHGNVIWECKCDCGTTKYVSSGSLLNGGTKSCGCITRDRSQKKDLNNNSDYNHTSSRKLAVGKASFEDLTGQRFGILTCVRPTDRRESGHIVWECVCDCGEITFMNASRLKRGRMPSCGCLRTIEDLSGLRFGKLTVIRHTGVLLTGPVYWECKCDCGNMIYPSSTDLKSGLVCSCGCLK